MIWSKTLPEPNQVDATLMARLQSGETEAMADIYDRHSRTARRLVSSICQDTVQADGVVGDGFFRIWKERDTFRTEDGPFRSWAMVGFRNRALESVRSSDVRHEPSGLWMLPENEAEVVTLAMFGRLTLDELSVQLRLPRGAVSDLMRKGLNNLRRESTVNAGRILSLDP